MEILDQIAEALQKGDERRAGALTAEAIALGVPAVDVLQ